MLPGLAIVEVLPSPKFHKYVGFGPVADVFVNGAVKYESVDVNEGKGHHS